MSKSADPAKKLATLLKSLKSKHGVVEPGELPDRPDDADPLLHQLVYSFLLWETTANQALAAHKRLLSAVVDYNELRICLADDIVEILGDRLALARDRAVRLRATLNEIYDREHALSLAHLVGAGKRDARQYIETLEGCPRFVSARVVLIELEGHAAPVDDRLHALMVKHGLVDEQAGLDGAVSWLERKIRAAEGREPFLLLEAWRESEGASPRKRDAGALAFSRAEDVHTTPPPPVAKPAAGKTPASKSASSKAAPSKTTAAKVPATKSAPTKSASSKGSKASKPAKASKNAKSASKATTTKRPARPTKKAGKTTGTRKRS